MKQLLILSFIFPLLLATPVRAKPQQTKYKSICVAVLTATVGVGVYTTNIFNPSPDRPIFSLVDRLFRGKKSLHIFLAKGLGRTVLEYFDIQPNLLEEDEIVIQQEWNGPTPPETIEQWDDDTFQRNLIFDSTSTRQKATGIMRLPGLLIRFEFAQTDNGYEYVLTDLFTNAVLQSGQFVAVGSNASSSGR